ncbi:hypothetical protein IKJ53_01380, partial [bacterium]|nr:hypothetical protein [bacterium]
MKISYTPFEYNKFIKDNLNQNYLKQTGLSFSGDNFYSSNITSKNSAKVSFSASDKKNSEAKPENVDNLFKRIFKGIKTFVTDKKDVFATSENNPFATSENNPFATSENNPFDLRSKTYNLKKAKRGIKKRVLSDEFYSKDNFLAIKLNDILAKVQTQGHIQILNKLLDNKDLASQKNLSPYFERIIIQSDTKEKEDILLEVLDKIEANKHLINNEKFIVYVGLILLSTKSPESLKVLDSVFNNDDLLNNEHLMLNLSNILLYTNDEKNLQVVNSVFQKEELVKNKNVMGHLGDVLRFTKKEEHIELLNMVFEEEKLLNDR